MKQTISQPEFDEIKKQLSIQGEMRSLVASSSMVPLLPVGTTITVVPLKSEKVQRFDIVVFLNRDKLFCHYVWHLNSIPNPDGSDVFITKSLEGWEDLPISSNQILGRVSSHSLSFSQKFFLSFKGFLKRRFSRGILRR